MLFSLFFCDIPDNPDYFISKIQNDHRIWNQWRKTDKQDFYAGIFFGFKYGIATLNSHLITKWYFI